MTHACVGNLTTICSDNGLPLGWRQAIIWINAGILLIGPLETNLSEILIEILTFSFKKMRLKASSAKLWLFCPGLNVLRPHKLINGQIDKDLWVIMDESKWLCYVLANYGFPESICWQFTNANKWQLNSSYICVYIYIYIGSESLHMDMATQGFMQHGCNNRQATCIWTCNHRGNI